MKELIDIISCGLLMQMKTSIHLSPFDDVSSSGGYVLPYYLTIEALVSLSATINFIYCWLQGLEQKYLERSNIYFETMIIMFLKTPVEEDAFNRRPLQALFLLPWGGAGTATGPSAI